MAAAEYKHVVLGLIFLKYISDTFYTRRDELTRRFARDYFIPDAATLAEELEDCDKHPCGTKCQGGVLFKRVIEIKLLATYHGESLKIANLTFVGTQSELWK